MPRRAYAALAAKLVPVRLAFGEVLYAAAAPIVHVYLPCESRVSSALIMQVCHRHYSVDQA